MKKDVTAGMVGCLVVMMLTGLVLARPLCDKISIKITPNTLNLKSQGKWVTVHAGIPCSMVAEESVYLEGIQNAFIEADNCGNLVAKFDREAVMDNVSTGCVWLTLTGETICKEPFWGTDAIRVIEEKRKK